MISLIFIKPFILRRSKTRIEVINGVADQHWHKMCDYKLVNNYTMRIAICISGQIRTGCYAAPNIKRYLGEHLSNCDVFVHAWDFNMQKSNLRFAMQIPNVAVTPEIFCHLGDDADRFRDIWNPISMVVESYDTAVKRMEQERNVPACSTDSMVYRTNGNSDRWIPLYYSWYQSVLLKRDHELLNGFKYDLVVKLRADVVYPKSRRLAHDILTWQNDRSRFYTDIEVVGTRIDDVLWYASSDVMDRASCFWLKKLDNPSIEFNHYAYMMEKGIGIGHTGNVYAPLRYHCIDLGLDPLTQWGRIYAEDLRLYSHGSTTWNGKPVTVEEWITLNQNWLNSG